MTSGNRGYPAAHDAAAEPPTNGFYVARPRTLDEWLHGIYKQWTDRNRREWMLFADAEHERQDAMRFAVMCLTSPHYADVLERVNEHAATRRGES